VTEPLRIQLPRPIAGVRSVTGTGASASNMPAETTAPAAESQADPAELREALKAEYGCLLRARKALEQALEELPRLRSEIIREAEQQLLELALEIARKVLMQEIDAERYRIDPIVKEALLHVPVRQDVTVHLHPDDWARCQMAEESEGSSGGNVRFVADPGVRRAECLLETSEGIVESAVEGHLGRIAETLNASE